MTARLKTVARSVAWAAAGVAHATPLHAAHPGHGSHDGLLGGAAHLLVDAGALILVVLLGGAAAIQVRRRRLPR